MDNIHNPPLLSLHIMLPEQIERRLKKRTQEMPGASWPSWGGHITLVPNFVPLVSMDEIADEIETVCVAVAPFMLRFVAPVAVPDKTRADYFAVFLNVTAGDGSEEPSMEGDSPLHNLRAQLLAALQSLRQDRYPELIVGDYNPHVTLALGVSESEAQILLRGLRAEPFEAAFWVEEIWIIRQSIGDTARPDRVRVSLGRDFREAVLLD